MSAQFSENGFGRPSNYHVNKKRCWPGFMGTSWCVYVYLFIYFDGPGLCLQKMGNPKRTVDGSAKTFHLGENDIVSSTSRERKGVSRGTCLNSVMSKPHIYVGVRPNSAKRWPSRDERALKFAAIIINASSRKKRAVKKSKRFFFFYPRWSRYATGQRFIIRESSEEEQQQQQQHRQPAVYHRLWLKIYYSNRSPVALTLASAAPDPGSTMTAATCWQRALNAQRRP